MQVRAGRPMLPHYHPYQVSAEPPQTPEELQAALVAAIGTEDLASSLLGLTLEAEPAISLTGSPPPAPPGSPPQIHPAYVDDFQPLTPIHTTPVNATTPVATPSALLPPGVEDTDDKGADGSGVEPGPGQRARRPSPSLRPRPRPRVSPSPSPRLPRCRSRPRSAAASLTVSRSLSATRPSGPSSSSPSPSCSAVGAAGW